MLSFTETTGTRLTDGVPGLLHGRKAVVIGAASGIGRGIAQVFAAAGAELHVIDKDRSAVAATADELGARCYAVDATDGAALKRCLDDIAPAGQSIEVFASTVGSVSRRQLTDCPIDEWTQVFDLNVRTAYQGLGAALPALMRSPHGGSAILISSRVAFHGVRSTAAYSAAKGAINALVRQTASDYGWDGVRINAIAPAAVDDTGIFLSRANPDASRKQHIANVALSHARGRLITPRDVGMTALFLASDMSAMMTGQVLLLDAGQGGWSGTHRASEETTDQNL